MIDKFAKIEEFLNKIIEKLFSILKSILSKLVPKNIKIKYQLIKNNSYKSLISGKTKSAEKFETIITRVKNKLLKLKEYFLKIKSIDYKLIITKKLTSLKDYISTTPIKKIILKPFIWFKIQIFTIYFQFKPKTEVNSSIVLSVIGLLVIGSFTAYKSFNSIYEKEFPSRTPASVQEYDYRPEYLMYKRKSLKIFNIKMPIYAEKVGRVTSITVDFSLRTSTRHARFYLSEYEYKLKDYFFTQVELMSSEFPLEQEGKRVIKEMIINELNNFLESEGVDGVIEDVNILFMIAT